MPTQLLAPAAERVRRRIAVRGVVQGVGFRPFVYRLATELALDGWVMNDAAGVTIEVEGDTARVSDLMRRLSADAPALARVHDVALAECMPQPEERGFAIRESGAGRAATAIGPDSAICPDCLAEMFDPTDRRYRYAFTNCTNCGPRYTITRRLPYDRATTSMAAFAQCPHAREYRSPRDRASSRANACRPAPRLALVEVNGTDVGGGEPVAATLARLARGEIVAIKGLGWFHLACDARDAEAVARLRARPSREEKPFAVMVANAASLDGLAEVTPEARALLESVERPVVLLRKRAGADVALPGVAPGLAWLGAMLPYTPIHYLLFHEAAGRPAGTEWLAARQPLVLVMTSANPGGEPLATGNAEARRRLAGIRRLPSTTARSSCAATTAWSARAPTAVRPRARSRRGPSGSTAPAPRWPRSAATSRARSASRAATRRSSRSTSAISTMRRRALRWSRPSRTSSRSSTWNPR
jgi:hydrogenase maturation protein HypF